MLRSRTLATYTRWLCLSHSDISVLLLALGTRSCLRCVSLSLDLGGLACHRPACDRRGRDPRFLQRSRSVCFATDKSSLDLRAKTL